MTVIMSLYTTIARYYSAPPINKIGSTAENYVVNIKERVLVRYKLVASLSNYISSIDIERIKSDSYCVITYKVRIH